MKSVKWTTAHGRRYVVDSGTFRRTNNPADVELRFDMRCIDSQDLVCANLTPTAAQELVDVLAEYLAGVAA